MPATMEWETAMPIPPTIFVIVSSDTLDRGIVSAYEDCFPTEPVDVQHGGDRGEEHDDANYTSSQ